jgi:hypothetical protein
MTPEGESSGFGRNSAFQREHPEIFLLRFGFIVGGVWLGLVVLRGLVRWMSR